MEVMFNSGRPQIFAECIREIRLKKCPESYVYRFNPVDVILVTSGLRNLLVFSNMIVRDDLHFHLSLNVQDEPSFIWIIEKTLKSPRLSR